MSANNFQWSLRDYLQVFLHRKWLFIVPVVASVVVSAVVARVLPRVYRSFAEILVEEKRISNPLIEHIAVSRSIGDKMHVVRAKILSQSYLERLIKDMRLDVEYDNRGAMAFAIGELRRQIKLQVPGGQMIRVVCEREDPKEAKEIVDYLVDYLIEENLRLQDWEVQSALKYIDAQLDIYNKKLESSEIFIHGFSELMGATLGPSPYDNIQMLRTLPGVMNVDAQKLIKFESDLIEIGIEKRITKEKLEELRRRLTADEGEYVIHANKETDPILNDLINDLYSKQAKLDALLIDSTEDHPGVIKLRQEIELLSAQVEGQKKKRVEMRDYELSPMLREIEADIAESETDLRQLELKEEEFGRWVTAYRKKLQSLPEERLRKLKLIRDYTVDMNIYSLLKQKRETALLTQRLDIDEKGTRFQLLDPPQMPLGPIRPNVAIIMLLGIVMGVCMGGGLIFASEFADHSFRDITEARRYLDMPILGSISYIGSGKTGWSFANSKKYLFIAALALCGVAVLLVIGF
jgi:polysaccharide chain length determinant protein (PEP-CTERM system associated)